MIPTVQLHRFARALADQLDGWEYDAHASQHAGEPSYTAVLAGSSDDTRGARILIRHDSRKSGSWHLWVDTWRTAMDGARLHLDADYSASANASLGREPARIAGQIKRNVVPAALRARDALDAMEREHLAERAREAAAVRLLEESGYLCGPVRERRPGNDERVFYTYSNDASHCQLQVDKVRMRLDGISTEKAVQILAILGKDN